MLSVVHLVVKWPLATQRINMVTKVRKYDADHTVYALLENAGWVVP